MIIWQWEQGRGEYFHFENILAISRALVQKEGMSVSNMAEDTDLRRLVYDVAKLEFLPHKSGYTVWRNYARVFKVALLATDIPESDGKKTLKCTEICHALASGKIAATIDYMGEVMRNFYLNGPVFGARNYKVGDARVFPFCAIVRFLAARTIRDNKTFCATPDEVKDFLFQRQVTGDEKLDFFERIEASPIDWISNDQKRQVREMMIFASQCPFLKWDGRRLCIDLPESDLIRQAHILFEHFSPNLRVQEKYPHEEILNMGRVLPDSNIIIYAEPAAVISNDPLREHNLSVEGRRRAVNHIVIERSPWLRKKYFRNYPNAICDMTGAPLNAGFPWVKNILEIHHITPLSSPVRSGERGTHIDDLVALTPTSHRAVHEYYRQWIRKNKRDFSNKQEARNVYESAKNEYINRTGTFKWP